MAEQNRAEGYSITSGVNVRKVLGTGAVVLGTVAIIVAGVFAVRGFFPVQPPHAPPPPTSPAITQPLPRLQTDPHAGLRAFEAEKRALLNSYDWVDRDAGIVRIPIDRAIERLAQRGAHR
ncbi:MAG TPA: hypothetical protein VE965_06000 [Gammaproteobacteria bacterium]|nr:hypothetical protein [Gammaproteobacteria bacterium]